MVARQLLPQSINPQVINLWKVGCCALQSGSKPEMTALEDFTVLLVCILNPVILRSTVQSLRQAHKPTSQAHQRAVVNSFSRLSSLEFNCPRWNSQGTNRFYLSLEANASRGAFSLMANHVRFLPT